MLKGDKSILTVELCIAFATKSMSSKIVESNGEGFYTWAQVRQHVYGKDISPENECKSTVSGKNMCSKSIQSYVHANLI